MHPICLSHASVSSVKYSFGFANNTLGGDSSRGLWLPAPQHQSLLFVQSEKGDPFLVCSSSVRQCVRNSMETFKLVTERLKWLKFSYIGWVLWFTDQVGRSWRYAMSLRLWNVTRSVNTLLEENTFFNFNDKKALDNSRSGNIGGADVLPQISRRWCILYVYEQNLTSEDWPYHVHCTLDLPRCFGGLNDI